MSVRYFCSDPDNRKRGLAAAADAVTAGGLVVLPTDTVYGVGCDAFSPGAVAALLAAKGRGRAMPPPVLVSSIGTLDGIASGITPQIRGLAEAFWPGALTIVCTAQPTVQWDLGDTNGTVAVRMPLHPVALELLERTGPMAVSSANRTGEPAANSADQALVQLGDTVSVYLDGGRCGGGVASTIVDCTGEAPRLLRAGAVDLDDLRGVVPGVLDLDGAVAAS